MDEYKGKVSKENAPDSPHVERGSLPSGPLSNSISDQMTIEMGAVATKDPKKGF